MLETNRLILRKFTESDIEDVWKMRSDAEIMRFIREPQPRKETESWIKLVSSKWESQKIGFCAVIFKESQKFVGWCGFWELAESKEIELGYAIDKDFWGKGLAVEAGKAFLKYGFEDLNLEKILAVADEKNKASRRVMEKLGMSFDGIGEFYGRPLVHYTLWKKDREK